MVLRILLMLMLVASPAWAIDTKTPAGNIKFTPDDGGEWNDPDPTEVDAALEQIVERLIGAEAGGSHTASSIDILTNKTIHSDSNSIDLSTVTLNGIAADRLLLGDGTDSAAYVIVPECNTNNFLNYASGSFGCANPSTTTTTLENKDILAASNTIDFGSGVTVNGITDDDIIIGNTTPGTTFYINIPECNTGSALTYTEATHTLGCEASGGGSGVDIDGDGIIDCLDRDGDKVCEEGWPFDADGDGSSARTACVGVGDPLPSCLFNGDVVNQDYTDDTNCFLPMVDGSPKGAAERCDGTDGYTLAYGAVYHLSAGVAQIRFPCWNHDAWTAHGNTPGAAPPENVANDPRDRSTHNEQSDAAYLHCPLDEWGVEQYAIGWGSWSGTVRGEGTDLRRHQRMIDDGYLTGSYVRMDMGNYEDGVWFGQPNFIGGETVGWPMSQCVGDGACRSEAGATAMHPNRLSTTLGSTVGHGSIQDTPEPFATSGAGWTDEKQSGFMCICNSISGCGDKPGTVIAGHASADDWTEGLVKGQRLVLVSKWRSNDGTSNTTNPVYLEMSMARDGADLLLGVCTSGDIADRYQPCSSDNDCESGAGICTLCNDPQEIMVQYGHMGFLEDAGSSGAYRARQGVSGILGELDCEGTTCAVFAPPSEYFSGGVTIENVTYSANDTWNTPGDLCADTFTSEGSLHDGTNSTDPDCDTGFFIKPMSGSQVLLTRMVFKEWGHFGIDMGGMTTGFVTIKDNTFIHGYGKSIGDFGYGHILIGNKIKSSVFKNTIIGTFGPTMRLEGTTIENVTILGPFINLTSQYYSTIIDTKVIGTTWAGSLIQIAAGSRNNTIRNLTIEGTVNSANASSFNSVVLLYANTPTPVIGNIIENVSVMGEGMQAIAGGQFEIVELKDADAALGAGVYGNFFRNITSHHSDVNGCIIGKQDNNNSDPDLLYSKNTFSNISSAGGRIFCGWLNNEDPDDGTVPNVTGMMVAGVPLPDPIVVCHSLNLASAGTSDDNVLFNGDYNYRIQNAWCQMAVIQAQDATIEFKNSAGDPVTGTVTCTDPLVDPTHTAMTAGNSLDAGESLIFDNITAPTADVNVVVCADIIAEWQ